MQLDEDDRKPSTRPAAVYPASSIPSQVSRMSQAIEATCSAPVNIAVIKYWGKRDSKLILPTNSSLSVTLDQDDLRSTTTARLMEAEGKDRLWLNGKEEAIEAESRLGRCLAGMRKVRQEVEAKEGSSQDGAVVSYASEVSPGAMLKSGRSRGRNERSTSLRRTTSPQRPVSHPPHPASPPSPSPSPTSTPSPRHPPSSLA